MSDHTDPWLSADLDGDGRSDLVIGPVDVNHDGIADSFAIQADVFGNATQGLNLSFGDADGDGHHDIALRLDGDGDGKPDIAFSIGDQTDDWWPDSVKVQVDFTGDGHAEISARAHDMTGDLHPDLAELKLDLDSDGQTDFDMGFIEVGLPIPVPVPSSVIEQLWADVGTPSDLLAPFPDNPFAQLDASLANFSGPDVFEGLIHGTPEADLRLWEMQDGPASCAVASTSMVLRSIGVDASEPALAAAFERFGIYDPISGTRPDLIDEVVNFLSARDGLGIHATEIDGFTADDLTRMLDAGERPLVGLDAAELYPDAFGLIDRGIERLLEVFNIPEAGHAVQVIGIVETHSGRMVVLNDPGRPDGAGIEVPLDAFMAAAGDFGWMAMTVTRV